jgi:hypothetical protein
LKPRRKRLGLLFVLQHFLETLMPKKVPKKTTVRKRRKKAVPSNVLSIVSSKLQTFLSTLYQSRITWFAAGILLTAPLCPFAKGESAVMFLLRKLPVIQSVVQYRTADSQKQIAADAPNKTAGDKAKRQILATAFRSTAEKIRNKTLTTKDDVLSTMTAETASVLSAPDWKPTVFRVNQLIANQLTAAEDSLESLGKALEELGEAFE